MVFNLSSYLPILILLIVAVMIASALCTLPLYIANKKSDKEKLSPYECGFNPFADARQKFDIRFYLVAVLFVIFDLEIAFLLPWALIVSNIYELCYAIVFLAILTVGFIYEWKKGALEWE